MTAQERKIMPLVVEGKSTAIIHSELARFLDDCEGSGSSSAGARVRQL
jgi:hypothetical protein